MAETASVEKPICANCGEVNPFGSMFCNACGRALIVLTAPTKHLESVPVLPQSKTWGTRKFGQTANIRLQFQGQEKPLVISLPDTSKVTLGRAESGAAFQDNPLIDLTPYGALDNGVSRKHCELSRIENTLFIKDLGSTNGTFVNGSRLLDGQLSALLDADELRFGHLIAHWYSQ